MIYNIAKFNGSRIQVLDLLPPSPYRFFNETTGTFQLVLDPFAQLDRENSVVCFHGTGLAAEFSSDLIERVGKLNTFANHGSHYDGDLLGGIIDRGRPVARAFEIQQLSRDLGRDPVARCRAWHACISRCLSRRTRRRPLARNSTTTPQTPPKSSGQHWADRRRHGTHGRERRVPF